MSRSSTSPVALGFHPGNPRLVMTQYRRHIMSFKKSYGTARGLIHYRGFIQSYLWAKRLSLTTREKL